MIWRKRMIRIMATWWNGCGGKMDDHPVHAIQNHHPIPKWMFSQNHPCCWLVRHSRTSPYNDDLCLILVFTVFFLYALVYMYHDYVLQCTLPWTGFGFSVPPRVVVTTRRFSLLPMSSLPGSSLLPTFWPFLSSFSKPSSWILICTVRRLDLKLTHYSSKIFNLQHENLF